MARWPSGVVARAGVDPPLTGDAQILADGLAAFESLLARLHPLQGP